MKVGKIVVGVSKTAIDGTSVEIIVEGQYGGRSTSRLTDNKVGEGTSPRWVGQERPELSSSRVYRTTAPFYGLPVQ